MKLKKAEKLGEQGGLLVKRNKMNMLYIITKIALTLVKAIYIQNL